MKRAWTGKTFYLSPTKVGCLHAMAGQCSGTAVVVHGCACIDVQDS
jgi:hypothetical protein